MVKIKSILQKLRREWIKLRVQPIRVFCLHHVCERFDATTMNVSDWMELSVFKEKIVQLRKQGYKFISLTDAHNKLKKNYIRFHKYAVLAFDDGYSSLKEILPWLETQKIPVVLFINAKYLDGESYRKNSNERYLTKNELFALNHSFIEIGSHGYEHSDATKMDKEEFLLHIVQNIDVLQTHPCYIPFHAYTWGQHTNMTNSILQFKHIIPVYIDGMKNYNNISVIHREIL